MNSQVSQTSKQNKQLQFLNSSSKFYLKQQFQSLLKYTNTSPLKSFDLQQNSQPINKKKGIIQKSSNLFSFNTYDNKFTIKSICRKDFYFLKENFSSYNEYYRNNPDSLLAKIIGLCKITFNNLNIT